MKTSWSASSTSSVQQKKSKNRERKSKGNTWADQEDAFFGGKTTPKEGLSCLPCLEDQESGQSVNTRSSNAYARNPKQRGSVTAKNNNEKPSSRLGSSSLSKLSSFINLKIPDAPAARRQPVASNGSNYPYPSYDSTRSTRTIRNVPRSNTHVARPRSTTTTTATTTATTTNSRDAPPRLGNNINTTVRNLFSGNGAISQAISRHKCIHCHSFPHSYRYHPFFPSEKICASHVEESIPKCCSCQRYQPRNVEFLPIDTSDPYSSSIIGQQQHQDTSRVLCPACLRTAVLSPDDALPLYVSILDFFSSILGLTIWDGMADIPIHLVDYTTLNQANGGGNNGHTRGLCLWESRSYIPFPGAHSLLRHLTQRPTASTTMGLMQKSVTVTAILCLKGLPSNLTGSILAHETTHAWFRLHNECGGKNGERMDSVVEEGCCQLVAYLYLNYLIECSDDSASGDRTQPSEKKLKQYFKSCIEMDTNEVYGEGFRLAAKVYAEMGGDDGGGIVRLLDFVAKNHSFPPSLSVH